MADIIIVPGRGIYPDGSLYKDPQSRIKKAARLYNAGKAQKIIMSGGYSFHFENNTNVNEAHSMKDYATCLGVPAKDILMEDTSTHTLANAYLCKKVFCEPNNWRDIIVVASSEHLPRVAYVFGKVFGPKYDLQYVVSKRVIGPVKYAKELLHEIASMRLSKKWLRSVVDGDDASIRRIVLEKRPNDTIGELAITHSTFQT